MNIIKNIITVIVIIIILWISHIWFGGLFPNNVYYSDAVLLFYPPIIIIGTAFYFWKFRHDKKIAGGILIGGLIYCLGLGFLIIWDSLEMGCGKIFFNLINSC